MPQHRYDPSLRDFIRVLHRRQAVVYTVGAVCVGLAIVLCVITTRRYDASSTIELQKSNDALGLDSMVGDMTGGAGDSLSVNLDLDTQAKILGSSRLALKVITHLHLDETRDFHPRFTPIGFLLGLISPRGPADPLHASLEDSPSRRRFVLAVFAKNLTVKPLAGTRLIQVDYSSSDPKLAAAVVNDLVRQLIDYSFQVRFEATNQASKWLEAQLTDLRNQTTDLQTKVVAMQKATGLFGIGGTDLQGKPIVYSPVLDRLQQATAALSEAQANRILKGAVYETIKSGDAELISQLSGTSMGNTGSQGVATSLSLIQTLRGQEASLESEIAQESKHFGPAYPKLLAERASLARTQQSLSEEIGRVRSRAENDFRVAQQTEKSTRDVYASAQAEADKLNDKTIAFAILQREAQQSQDLYQDLLKRLKEAGVVEGLHSSNLTVIDEASPPAKPSKPNVPLYLFAGVVLGVFVGCGSAIVANAIDNHIRGTDDIEALNLPLLGMLPAFAPAEQESGMPALAAPQSGYAEALRGLRATLLLARSGSPPKVIMVTSSAPGEGKTTTALNLAIIFAGVNKKVLLLESDMRRPTLQRRLHLPPATGLSQLLSHEDQSIQEQPIPQLSSLKVLSAGPVPPYPVELLSSPRFSDLIGVWANYFDFIVIDTPPILPVADARVIAGFADVILMIARSEVTTRATLQRAYSQLKLHAKNPGSPAIGVVLNAVQQRSAVYYEYYGYKHSEYYAKGNRSEDN